MLAASANSSAFLKDAPREPEQTYTSKESSANYMGVSENKGYPIWGPYYEDPTI